MTIPRRIQRRRAKGWRLPPGTVYVGRPTKWGNPHPAGRPCPHCPGAVHDHQEATSAYRAWITAQPALITAARRELAGRDLACWCPPDQPCHADVLLEIANPTPPEEPRP